MILYEYQCKECEKITEALRAIDDRNNCPQCECGGETTKIISKSAVHPDFEPYLDENIGKEPTWVKSKQHRKKLMKQNGVRDFYS